MSETVLRIEVVGGGPAGPGEAGAPSTPISPSEEQQAIRDSEVEFSNLTREVGRRREEEKIRREEERRAVRMQREDDAAQRKVDREMTARRRLADRQAAEEERYAKKQEREKNKRPSTDELLNDPDKFEAEAQRRFDKKNLNAKMKDRLAELEKQVSGAEEAAGSWMDSLIQNFGIIKHFLPYGYRRFASKRLLQSISGSFGKKPDIQTVYPESGSGSPPVVEAATSEEVASLPAGTTSAAGAAEGAGAAAGAGAMAALGPIALAVLAEMIAKRGVRMMGEMSRNTIDTGASVMSSMASNDRSALVNQGTQVVDKFADVAEYAGLAGTVLGEMAKTGTAAVRAFNQVTDAFIERGREIQQFSPELTSANVSAEIRSMRMDMREAQELGSSIARLTEVTSEADAELRELLLPIKETVVDFLAFTLKYEILPVIRFFRFLSNLSPGGLINMIKTIWKGSDDPAEDLLNEWIGPLMRQGRQERQGPNRNWRRVDPMVPVWK